MFGVTVAAAVAAAGALWIYVARERLGVAGAGMAALRTAAVAVLAGLLANPVRTLPDLGRPPVVLLDASLSMQAAGGRWSAARDSARAIAGARGTVLRFGDVPVPDDTSPPTFPSSRLAPALAAAAGFGGPVTVITDGEVGDASAIPAALRATATILVLPRDTVPDVALVEVQLRDRIAADDTLEIALTLRRRGPVSDSVALAGFAGARRIVTGRAAFTAGATARATLTVPARVLGPGVHRLRFTATALGDAEPRTDERYRLVEVSALPAVTLVASPPGWEARFLATQLADIVRAPVGAYAEVAPGRWIDMATQQAVPVARVATAVRSARLVIRLGAPVVPDPRSPTWDWPVDDARRLAGEWYAGAPPASPLAARLAGVAWDSLPPLTGALPVAPGPAVWTGLAARLARRGAERPVLVGTDSAGARHLVTAGEGLWRWALRGGAAREAYRAVVAAGVDWLLGGGAVRDAPLVVDHPVVGLGEPVVFRWTRGEAPERVEVRFTAGRAGETERREVLAFSATGEARVALAPGFWSWRAVSPAVSGVVAVEPYAPEFVPAPVSLATGPAAVAVGTRVAGLREWWWLYLLVVGLLLGEWAWRQRRGLP